MSAASSCLVLDMSCVSFCDSSGLAALESIVSDLKKEDAEVWLSNCTPEVINTIVNSRSKIIDESKMFLNVNEAVKALTA